LAVKGISDAKADKLAVSSINGYQGSCLDRSLDYISKLG
jgi:hypothetical protein